MNAISLSTKILKFLYLTKHKVCCHSTLMHTNAILCQKWILCQNNFLYNVCEKNRKLFLNTELKIILILRYNYAKILNILR